MEFPEGASVCECSYCGTKQTLPKISGEQSAVLYERADHFRRNNDFDKAISIYEQILNADNTDAEAYWSLVLCRFGVEYVEDPKSQKRIATVNRMQYTSVLADEDYKSAVKYADAGQKAIYEAEAKEIDTIQKGILAISKKEEPFDVFICYKETDKDGRRTPDSVLASELYNQLKKEGYEVFFSRVTLEDKLGTAYEPYIFAALNSAKVMVVIGTKPEYFEAVWVKNEWSRFLALIKNGQDKTLIPAYRDMDPYLLPEEFSHLQAQDMAKLGFMQDLLHGIEKLAKNPHEKREAPAAVVAATSAAPLLDRAFLFLEDGDFASAEEYSEKVLDMEPRNAEAYVCKLLVELRVKKREQLADCKTSFENNGNYQKALRFGDDELISTLRGYINKINERAEIERLDVLYLNAVTVLNGATTKADFEKAAAAFAAIGEYKDAPTRAKECEKLARESVLAEKYVAANSLLKSAKTEEEFLSAAKAFGQISDYKDSEKLSELCEKKADELKKDKIYVAAIALMTGNKIKNYQTARTEFEKLGDFKDAPAKGALCAQRIAEIEAGITAAALERQKRAEERERRAAERERRAAERSQALAEASPRIKKIAMIVVPILVLAILAAIIIPKIDFSKPASDNTADTGSTDAGANISSAPGSGDGTTSETPSTEPTSSTTDSSKPSSGGNSTTSKKPSSNSSLPSTPQSAEANDFEYHINEYGVIINGYHGNSKNITIPSFIKGLPVTEIAGGAFSDSDIKSVVIPETVTQICQAAFARCFSLTSVKLPSSVKYIDLGAFSYCSSLSSINFPVGLERIGSNAFECCNLTEVTLPWTVVEVGQHAFASNHNLKKITLNERIRSVPDGLCYECENLETAILPAATSIGGGAFELCQNLETITSSAIISVGTDAFRECYKLKNITIATNAFIGPSAFAFTPLESQYPSSPK
ncbi:MAG: leucine-rich repeat protein [Clostridia bacterium]|nr:leucine-rich repeat protein [Clostridia bacterium]